MACMHSRQLIRGSLLFGKRSYPCNRSQEKPCCASRSCCDDEGRPLGAGFKEQAPKHLKLLCSKGPVVSVEEKAGIDPSVKL